MSTPHKESHYNPNKLEMIIVIEDELPQSLEQALTEDKFNWTYIQGVDTYHRLEVADSDEKFKQLVAFCEVNNLNAVVVLGSDHKSYIEWLKHAPQGARIMVYLDNKRLVKSLIKNPSAELYANWSSVALGGKTSDFAFSTNQKLNLAVAEGFTTWLEKVEATEQLSNKLISLSESDFVKKGEWDIHQHSELIARKGRQWLGSPNKFQGFKIENAQDDWQPVGQFYLQAAAGQKLEYWYENDIPLPEFVIEIETSDEPDEDGFVFVTFRPRSNDQSSKELMQNKLKKELAHLLSETGNRKVACRITYQGEIVIEIPELSVTSDFCLCDGEGRIEKLDLPASNEIAFTVELKKL